MNLDVIYSQSYKDTFLNVMQVNDLNKNEINILMFWVFKKNYLSIDYWSIYMIKIIWEGNFEYLFKIK